ncbi:MAG: hypothetical protein JXA01_02410, partial [Dehalococcoidia bacterium]|nr:hypothetical protein [Dehalococcoidia bacterium]
MRKKGILHMKNPAILQRLIIFLIALLAITSFGCSSDQISTDLYEYLHKQTYNQTKFLTNTIEEYSQHIDKEEILNLQVTQFKRRWGDFSFLSQPNDGAMWKGITWQSSNGHITNMICCGYDCVVVDPYYAVAGLNFRYDTKNGLFCHDLPSGLTQCYRPTTTYDQSSFADEVREALQELHNMENEIV